MAITQLMNPKANVRKTTDSDLFSAGAQAVIAKYGPVESTAAQVVINLTFSISQTLKENFMLVVDGKVLSEGSAYDYTFTAIQADNTSSQVTLNVPLAAGYNIQAWKLGFKKEVEFLTDNRFVSAYDYLDQGSQAFISPVALRVATTSAGAPVAGTFYSTIVNRAPCGDFSLRTAAASERVSFKGISEVQNEIGPAGQRVYAPSGDYQNSIRFCGGWVIGSDINGGRFLSATVDDFIEIVFFGTGLNLVTQFYNGPQDLRVSVDGGAEGANIAASNASPALGLVGLNRTLTQSVPAATGLALGVHTARIRIATAFSLNYTGHEILNESANVSVNAGVAYSKGQKYVASSVQSVALTAPVTGTRGGRVLTYLNANGTIGQAFTPVGSQANLTSADHSNEEGRKVNFREFGTGSSTDFNFSMTTPSARSFTLSDESTTLRVNDAVIDASSATKEGIVLAQTSSSRMVISFVGTGLDVFNAATLTNTSTWSVFVDGNSIAANATLFPARSWTKLVSGLPYGQHTVHISQGSTVGTSPRFSDYMVYQPKKPTLPDGAVELSEHNVLATFAANTVAGQDTVATGVIRKSLIRAAHIAQGTGGTQDWVLQTGSNSFIDGNYINSDRLNATIDFVFFGTGFEFRGPAVTTNGSTSVIVSLQAVTAGGALVTANTTNFPTMASSVYGGFGFTAGTGVLTQNGANTSGSGLRISNLPLGTYRVRFTNNAASTFLRCEGGLDIITPVHSTRRYNNDSTYQNFQDAHLGSCGVSDLRKFTPTRPQQARKLATGSAQGISTAPTNNVLSVPVPMPEMVIPLRLEQAGEIEVNGSVEWSHSASNGQIVIWIYVNGVQAGQFFAPQNPTASIGSLTTVSFQVPVGAGMNVVQIMYSAGTAGTVTIGRRQITAKELP